MLPGLLVFIPGGGTFTVIGSPLNAQQVQLANSGDPANAPTGTLISAGTMISPANMRGPIGPAGGSGPPGPPGPQGASGTSAYTTLAQAFTIPATVGTAFVIAAGSFAAGQIVYLPTGNYFSIQAVDQTLNTLTLVNQSYPGQQPAGTVIPVGSTVSATGPQGPQGVVGPAGPQGIQGPVGLAPTGTITMYGAATPPGGWLICDGSAVSRTTFSALFSIISTTYGSGDGSSTFNLPNLQGRFALGVQGTTYPLASAGGEATHTLTLAELAAHNHSASASASQADHQHGIPATGNHTHFGVGINHASIPSGSGGGSFDFLFSTANGTPYWNGTTSASGNIGPTGTYPVSDTAHGSSGLPAVSVSVSVANNGNGAPHNNLPPYQTVQYIIKV
jgi:microcystin-dependent protein